MLTSKKDRPSHESVRVEGIAEERQGLRANKNERGDNAVAG